MQSFVINLLSIPHEGITRRLSSSAAALGIDDPHVALVRPLDLQCHFLKIDRQVVVQGTLRSAVRLSCSRCTEEFVLPLTLALEAIYLPVSDASSERAKDLEDEGTDVYAYEESAVDLGEMVRDKLFMSIPLQPYCTPGCKGLCPACGVNRNTVYCQCAEEKLGSPFEQLKELRFS
jgi:uncharacterized protein